MAWKYSQSEELVSISEFSKHTGISRSALIYYDDHGLFHPVERGENNYRYYSLHQIITVKVMRVLSELNVPLRTIKKLYEARTPELCLETFQQKREEISRRIEEMQLSCELIDTFMGLAREGLAVADEEVSVKTLPALAIQIGEENAFDASGSFFVPFLKFYAKARRNSQSTTFPVGGLFGDFPQFESHPAQPNNFFFVNPKGLEQRPAGEYLVGHVRGFYGETGDITHKMFAYASEHKLELVGPVYNIYLLDEISEKDPDKYLLEVSVMIRRPS